MLPLSPFVRRLSQALVLLVGIVGVFFAASPSAFARTTYAPGSTIVVRTGIAYGAYYLEAAPSSAPTPIVWTVSSGMLPPGLTLDTAVSRLDNAANTVGTATTPGTYVVQVRGEDATGTAHEGVYTFDVYQPSLVINPPTIADATLGAPFSKQLSLETSTGIRLGATQWAVYTSSFLPPGLALDSSTGLLSGTPTASGTYNFRLYAIGTTAGSSYAYRDFTLRVNAAAALRAVTTTPSPATVGTAYSYRFTAEGGAPGYAVRVLNAAQLPPGLSLTGDGFLSGTPTVAGTYSFTIKIEDQAGASVAPIITMSVAAASSPLTVTPSLPLLSGRVGVSYPAQLIRATGGRGSYTWSIISGNFPLGLNIATVGMDGMISGTPTVAGTYAFQVRVDDGSGASAFAPYTITIAPATVTSPIIVSPIITPPIVTSPIVSPIVSPLTPALTTRLNVLSGLGISVHSLVKLPDDGNRLTQADSAVYYIGADGRRHAFSNDKVYFTWYTDFAGVRTVSASALASIPLGANVTYKPGVKLVKFQTDARVYVVLGRQLRSIASESVAIALYGSTWNRQIDDISDAFYGDYQFGTDVRSASDFSVEGARNAVASPSDALPAV